MLCMKRRFFYFINLFVLLLPWTGSGSIFAKDVRGAAGTLPLVPVIKSDGSPDKITSYTLELLPGQVFSGWYYFWLVSGDSISASLSEEIDQPWLTISPTTFSSGSCEDIKPVEFTFQAPLEPGVYSVTIIDNNQNWDDVLVTIYVTSNPTIVDSRILEVPVNETHVQLDTIGWYGFTNFSCVDLYIPGDTSRAKYTLYPTVDWLKITPSQMTFRINQTAIVQKKFLITEPGSFEVYEVLEGQWFSSPRFIHWQVNVVSSIEEKYGLNPPGVFSLEQNYPNPFNPATTISYQLASLTDTDLSIYNTLGQKIITLFSGQQPAGMYHVRWDASGLPSGIYYYRLETGSGFAQTRKLILLR
jgi:hypothetical protein